MRLFRVFGRTLLSDYPFAERFLIPEKKSINFQRGDLDDTGKETFDLILMVWQSDSPPLPNQPNKPIFASPINNENGESVLYLYKLEDDYILRFTGEIDYLLRSDQIQYCLINPTEFGLIENYFLGPVISLYLELLGVVALHASSIVVNGQAIGFLSGNGGGKTSLSATLMREGFPLLTDDILPVEDHEGTFFASPGYPTMRMWPDVAQTFLGGYEHLELVHPDLDKRRVFVGADGFGSFHDAAEPLSCIYLPERRPPQGLGNQIEIQPVPPREAFIELLRYSFAPRLVEALGIARQRMEFLTRLASQVAVKRLIYPSGFEFLPQVAGAILADLEGDN